MSEAAAFSRANPSPRYRELLALYRRLHAEGERHLDIPARQTFDGRSLLPHGDTIRMLVQHYGARTILDYGSGKGRQYGTVHIKLPNGETYDRMEACWGVERIACYDPAYPPFSALPEGPFDGVICTDVLEHCPEQDLDWIVGELLSLAGRFVFANVAGYSAKKRLPNGENAHPTVRPTPWWQALFARIGAERPSVRYHVIMAVEGSGSGSGLTAERFSG